MTGRRWACFIALEQNFVQGRTILTSVVLMPSGEKGRISPTVNLECDVRKASLVRVFAIGPFCSHCFVAKSPLAHTTPRRRTGRGCQCQRRVAAWWLGAGALPPTRWNEPHAPIPLWCNARIGEGRTAQCHVFIRRCVRVWNVAGGGPVRTHLSPCCHF